MKKIIVLVVLIILLLITVYLIRYEPNKVNTGIMGGISLNTIIIKDNGIILGGDLNWDNHIIIKSQKDGEIIDVNEYGKNYNSFQPDQIIRIGKHNIMLTGNKLSDNRTFNMVLILINDAGEILWSKLYSKKLISYSSYNYSDEEIIIAGITNERIPFIMNIDMKGNINKYIELKEVVKENYLGYISSISKSGYLIVSNEKNQENEISRNPGKHIIKLDKKFKKIWDKEYEGNVDINEIKEINNENYIFILNKNDKSSFIEQLNKNGEVVITKNYKNLIIESIYETGDNNYIAVAETPNYDCLVMKLNDKYEEIWVKNYKIGHIYSIEVLYDNSILLLTEDSLLKIDSKGNKKWIKNYDYNKLKTFLE